MIEVLKQALDAFHQIFESTPVYHNDGTCIINDKSVELSNKAIASLRQAIAELESQEPVAWIDFQKEAQQIVESKVLWKKFIDGTPLANDIACWMADFALQHTHPPQRTWQGLTDDEHCDIWYKESLDWMEYGKAIEAKLKERNI